MRNKAIERQLANYAALFGLELVGVENVHTLERLDEAKTMVDEIKVFLEMTGNEGTVNHCYECGITVVVTLADEPSNEPLH